MLAQGGLAGGEAAQSWFSGAKEERLTVCAEVPGYSEAVKTQMTHAMRFSCFVGGQMLGLTPNLSHQWRTAPWMREAVCKIPWTGIPPVDNHIAFIVYNCLWS